MIWRVIILCLAVGTLTAFPTSANPPAAQVFMDSGSPYYVPAAVTVTAGAAVRWDNPTPTHHTVTHDGCFEENGRCAFDSGAVDTGRHLHNPQLASWQISLSMSHPPHYARHHHRDRFSAAPLHT